MRIYNLFFILIVLLSVSSCDPTIVNPNNIATSICGEWELAGGEIREGESGIKIQVRGDSAVIVDAAGSAFQEGDTKWRNIITQGLFFLYDDVAADGTVTEDRLLLFRENSLFANMRRLSIETGEEWKLRKYIPCETILLSCQDFQEAVTLADGPDDIDYIVPPNCVINVWDRMTIEPGVTIAFSDSSGIDINAFATLIAQGTSSQPISMQGVLAGKGSWRGLHFGAESNVDFDYVTVSGAGQLPVQSGKKAATIFFDGDNFLTLSNTTLREGAALGVAATGNTADITTQNLTVESHDDYPLYLPFDALNRLDGLASSYTGNVKDTAMIALSTSAFSIDEATTISKLNVPYLIEAGSHQGKAILTIEQGVELNAEADVELIFTTPGGTVGNLIVNGTSTEPVIWKGALSRQGYWKGIFLDIDPVEEGQINYLQISDAGGSAINGAGFSAQIYLNAGKLTVSNSSFTDSRGCGIAYNSGATLIETNNAFTNNAGGDVCD